MEIICRFVAVILLLFLPYVGKAELNNPYQLRDDKVSVLYTTFSSRPKHLDPARSYTANESVFTANIYEPPLQYHYLKRPYELVPLAARKMPEIIYRGYDGRKLPVNANYEDVATTTYLITLRDDVRYQAHPAFAKNEQGEYLYHKLTSDDLKHIFTLNQFEKSDSRLVEASDYQFQIMRLADPINHSPIATIMSKRIVGFKELEKALSIWRKGHPNNPLIASDFDIEGVEVINKNQYKITVYGKDAQFIYWLAMPFFASMPPEAELFYRQEGLKDKNITLDWYPIGSGPYLLEENNPNRQMVLRKNPNYHTDYYPSEGEKVDKFKGLLDRQGELIPQIDKVVFSLEKESIPMWNKFLQGYYDRSGISSDVFDQAVYFDQFGEINLTEDMKSKEISLSTTVDPSVFFWGFNMLDPVVGGYSEKQRQLRQAISIAFDIEEFISIFMNGRALAAHGPLPPGIFGYTSTLNSYVYDISTKERRSLDEAKKLLKKAGYPNGIDPKNNTPLTLNLDAVGSGAPDEKAKFQWMRQQFEKLGIQLNIRVTQYNRFQEKVRNGQVQIFAWGWHADYPDPENFLMLLYGPNSRAKYQGENAVNYQNKQFDELYEQMVRLEDGVGREKKIREMITILRQDSPWIWGLYPKSFILSHQWYYPIKPNTMANNLLKYAKIDPKLRSNLQTEWNKPLFWPVIIICLALFLFGIPVVVSYWRKEHQPVKKLSFKKVLSDD
ncbi:ABC transporter substrate-binding protein [Thiotrichales bacterium 19S11-10]|nr:ABC transporter substrate-binding protein [Thiotrichales bacterium 19S11-10]